MDWPRGCRRLVNEPRSEKELERLYTCLGCGQPYGDEAWTRRAAVKLGLESRLRPVGRPRKVAGKAEYWLLTPGLCLELRDLGVLMLPGSC